MSYFCITAPAQQHVTWVAVYPALFSFQTRKYKDSKEWLDTFLIHELRGLSSALTYTKETFIVHEKVSQSAEEDDQGHKGDQGANK